MAFTASTIFNAVPGNTRMWSAVITPDAATGVVTVPGANSVDAVVSFDLKSGTSLTCVNVARNLDASGAAANGVIGFSNVVANQTYHLTVLYH